MNNYTCYQKDPKGYYNLVAKSRHVNPWGLDCLVSVLQLENAFIGHQFIAESGDQRFKLHV